MEKLFGNIFDNIDSMDFDEFCLKNKDYCTQYLFAGFQSAIRKDYEEIFQIFQEDGLIENNFIQQSQEKNEKFTQRMWELTIFYYLKNQGIFPTRKKSGPDFQFCIDGFDVDIECVAPESGKVPKFKNDCNFEFGPSNLDEPIILRLLQSIYSKLGHKNQSPSGLNAYLIALCTANIDWEFHTRRIYQALFGLRYPGSNNSCIYPETNNKTLLGLFRNDTHSTLSAIIYSNNHPNHFREGSNTDVKIYMIHNPFAKFPIKIDIFPNFQHVVFNPDTLEIFDGTENSGELHLGQILKI